jgi:transglutaminase-like putative cysteine protease
VEDLLSFKLSGVKLSDLRLPEIKLPDELLAKLPTPRKRPAEDSVELRAWVLAAILVGEVAVLSSGYFDWVTGVLVPLLTVVAFVVSRRRRAKNFLIKVMLAFAALAVLAMFFREVLGSLYDTRVPLARLFLWVQVIHAFDLPARKDVAYSLISGLILVAVGGVLSTSMVFGLFIIVFLICALGALSQIKLSEAREKAGAEVETSRGFVTGLVLPGALAVAVIGVSCFSLLPQSRQMSLAMMPTSLFQQVRGDFSGSVQNPDYPTPGGDPFAGPPQNISPDSYHGFNPYMDLRSRGRLSDEIVMKVRSEEPTPYRGVVFDEYNGKGWEISTKEEDMEELRADGPRYDLAFARETEPAEGPTREVSQVFTVTQDSSNVVFGAYRPETVFFPASGMKVDPYNSLRAPYEIPTGSTYSVVSQVPNASPEQLRSASTSYPAGITDKYLDLPTSGLGRTRKLADELTANAANPYDAVLKMNEHLKAEYPYDLSIPPQRQRMDAVEYFLFEEQRGYCEQFSSSLAVMARSQGIPARIATGYVSGEYNPFTGLYEVKASDAHAWVEVYFPGYGWSTFDPTPSFDSTPWEYQQQSNTQGSKAFTYLAEKAGGALSPALGAVGALMRGVARFDPVSILVLGALVASVAAAVFYGRKYAAHKRREPVRQRSVKVSDARLYSRYRAVMAAFEEAGIARDEHETPEEYARRLSGTADDAGIARLGEIYLYVRFRDAVPVEMVEEFDHLEPEALAGAQRLSEREGAAR